MWNMPVRLADVSVICQTASVGGKATQSGLNSWPSVYPRERELGGNVPWLHFNCSKGFCRKTPSSNLCLSEMTSTESGSFGWPHHCWLTCLAILPNSSHFHPSWVKLAFPPLPVLEDYSVCASLKTHISLPRLLWNKELMLGQWRGTQRNLCRLRNLFKTSE